MCCGHGPARKNTWAASCAGRSGLRIARVSWATAAASHTLASGDGTQTGPAQMVQIISGHWRSKPSVVAFRLMTTTESARRGLALTIRP